MYRRTTEKKDSINIPFFSILQACLVHNHDPPPAGGRPGFLSYEEVKASEGTIRELCRTNLTTAKICRFLERDGLGLGPVGKMQARAEVIVTVYT